MKKWLLPLAGLALAFTLAGCADKTVATTSGGKITESEYYKEMKDSTSGKQTLQTMILNKVLDKQYGDKVKDSAVNKQYNAVKSSYGSTFSSTLTSNGLTATSFKAQIRANLETTAALKDLKKVTNADLKTQFKSYEPKITVAHILVATKAEAETIIKQLNTDSKGSKFNATTDFAALAKKYSTDTATATTGGKLPAFDNTDTSLDDTFKAAAFKVKQGQWTTTPVQTTYGYHVILSIKNPGKGTWQQHKKVLKEQVYTTWLSDTTVMHDVISKVLTKGNVSIKDSDLKDILAGYVDSSSSKKSSSSSASSSSAAESTTEESSSAASSSEASSSSATSSSASK